MANRCLCIWRIIQACLICEQYLHISRRKACGLHNWADCGRSARENKKKRQGSNIKTISNQSPSLGFHQLLDWKSGIRLSNKINSHSQILTVRFNLHTERQNDKINSEKWHHWQYLQRSKSKGTIETSKGNGRRKKAKSKRDIKARRCQWCRDKKFWKMYINLDGRRLGQSLSNGRNINCWPGSLWCVSAKR